jgi:LysM repeat protein
MSRPLAAILVLLLAGAAQAQPGKEDDALVYRMVAGDTLYSLARWARVRVPALLAANPGIDPRAIEIGDEIRLPAGALPPGPVRFRERGDGPGPAAERPPPRPRELRQAPPPAPSTDKPDGEDERAPMGM